MKRPLVPSGVYFINRRTDRKTVPRPLEISRPIPVNRQSRRKK